MAHNEFAPVRSSQSDEARSLAAVAADSLYVLPLEPSEILVGDEATRWPGRLYKRERARAAAKPRLLLSIPLVPKWTIRAALEDDIGAVLDLWTLAEGPSSVTDTREGLRVLLATDSQALMIAEHNSELVGSLIAAWDGWRGSFYRLAVHPAYRRHGIARALVREGERSFRAHGAVRFTAIVDRDDQVATGFWQAVGYTIQPDRTRFTFNV